MHIPKRLKSWCLDLVFPHTCVGCGIEGSLLCSPCRGKLSSRAPACPVCSKRNFTGIVCDSCAQKIGLRRFLAPFSYRDPLIRELIFTFKYGGVRDLDDFFAQEIAEFLAFYGIRVRGQALLVPIPLHRSRERERGFNQALLLAERLGQRLHLPARLLLSRIRATESQTQMHSYAKRHENVGDAFALQPGMDITHQTIILVDDVSTSGATLSEAARVLRDAGARSVWAFVIAKG